MKHTGEQNTVRGRRVEKHQRERKRVCVRVCVYVCVCVCVCVCVASGVCTTAGNQAGTDLVSWGCGGSDLISNEYNRRERERERERNREQKPKALCLTPSESQAQRAQSPTLRTKHNPVSTEFRSNVGQNYRDRHSAAALLTTMVRVETASVLRRTPGGL